MTDPATKRSLLNRVITGTFAVLAALWIFLEEWLWDAMLAFMAWLGKYSWLKSAAVALGVTISLFLMFEVWFKVPLFKGTLDPLSFLGY